MVDEIFEIFEDLFERRKKKKDKDKGHKGKHADAAPAAQAKAGSRSRLLRTAVTRFIALRIGRAPLRRELRAERIQNPTGWHHPKCRGDDVGHPRPLPYRKSIQLY